MSPVNSSARRLFICSALLAQLFCVYAFGEDEEDKLKGRELYPTEETAPPPEEGIAPDSLYDGPVIRGRKQTEAIESQAQDMKVRVLKHLIERMRKIEERLRASDKVITDLNDRTTMLLLHQPVKLEDKFYVRANVSLIFPRRATFPVTTDTGLGMHVGGGRYFGTKHVVDLGFDWDFYPAVALTYRYLFEVKIPRLSLGPILGIKLKIANGPLDNFILDPTAPKSTYYVGGLHIAFPIVNAVITSDILAVFNSQLSIQMMGGLQFIL